MSLNKLIDFYPPEILHFLYVKSRCKILYFQNSYAINRLTSDSNLSLGSCLGGIICYPPRCSACASFTFVMCCAICYDFYNSKNVKTSHGRVLLLVKLQASTCNFTKSNFPPWVFITFFKLYKWYQIAQRITFLKLFDQNE